ncbi:MAG: hypothetical protein QG607_11 [Patescibacteria group bacterium]|jgi:hypothetical protein|nr:hypothetical protein [Patescibacteria group bacterium]
MLVEKNSMRVNYLVYPIKYDPEADVLSWKINSLQYDDAVEIGDLIIQVSRWRIPAYAEMLNASHHFGFLKKRRKKFTPDGTVV